MLLPTHPLRATRHICLALLALTAWALSCHAYAQARCERVEIIAPTKGLHTGDSKPEIRWQGNPQNTYRLQVAVVLPEGRLLDSIDTQVVGTRWAFGAPMPVPLAAVKVVVSRNCDSYTVQDLHAAPPHFFYDARAQCTIEPMSMVQTQNTLRWKTVGKADKFAITLFETSSEHGKLKEVQRIDRVETTEPFLELSGALLKTTVVASVQAQCGEVWSQPRGIAISGLKR